MSGSGSASCLLVLDGCIYLNKAPSLGIFVVCLLVALAFPERGIRFLQQQFSSVSNTSYNTQPQIAASRSPACPTHGRI